MYVLFELESGWSNENMRFAEYDEAVEFMRGMTARGYEMGMRMEP